MNETNLKDFGNFNTLTGEIRVERLYEYPPKIEGGASQLVLNNGTKNTSSNLKLSIRKKRTF